MYRAFVQRMAGYAMTGDVSEQCLFFAHGGGANGKSTLLTVLQAMMGDYARQAAPELLVSRGGDRHPTELADLFGARLVTSVEVDDGKRLAEALVKQMTGGDKMKARFMRADFFEWTPTHKLVLAANHRPEIRGTDYAMWRRIHLVPFTVTIPAAERDGKLPGQASRRATGHPELGHRWMHGLAAKRPRRSESRRGCHRRVPPERPAFATFITDCCFVDGQAYAASSGLYRTYTSWCENGGTKAVSGTALESALRTGLHGRKAVDRRAPGQSLARNRPGWRPRRADPGHV